MTTPQNTAPDETPYVLMTSVETDGKLAKITDSNSLIRIAMARMKPGSLTDRILDDVKDYASDDMQIAVIDFFDRLRASGLSGVLDTPEVRVRQKDPLGFCHAMTEEIWDMIDSENDEDVRDDDFDNHPLSPLRECMVDASPEFGGGDALQPGA